MVVHNYYPIGEPRVQRQVEALVGAGAQVEVVCLRDKDDAARETQGNVTIHRVNVRRDKKRGLAAQFGEYVAFLLLAFWQVTRLYFQVRPNVVQVHNLPDFLVFCALVPRLAGTPVVLDLHDLMPEFYISRFGGNENNWAVRLVKLQERVSCGFASHVITVTHPWREALIKRGVPAEKCSVVMNLADDRIFFPRSAAPDARTSLQLIYHGTLTHRYGIDLALRAVAQARAAVPGLRLLIHGRGEYLGELEKLAAELNLQDSVTFSTRLLPMEELPKLIAASDVGLVPYRRDPFTDGILPTKLMEYAAMELPAIAVRTPVIDAYFTPEMLEVFEANDVNALAAAIIRLGQDVGRRAELKRQIRKFSERYNWKKQRADYLALVSRLAGRATLQAP